MIKCLSVFLSLTAILITSFIPTADAGTDNSWMEYKMPYIGEQNDVTNPNKTGDEVLVWAQQVVTNSLTMDATNINEKISGVKKDFDKQGWSQFAAYVKKINLIDAVKNRGFRVTTIFNDTGTVLDSRAMQGTYRWLVTVPVMMSFQKENTEGTLETVGNNTFDLILQIGRQKQDNQFTNDLSIEAWKVEDKTP